MAAQRIRGRTALAVLLATLSTAASSPCWPAENADQGAAPETVVHATAVDAVTTPAAGCWAFADPIDYLNCPPAGTEVGGPTAPAQSSPIVDEITWRRRASD